MAHLDKVRAAGVHLGVDGRDPGRDAVHVLDGDAEGGSVRVVDVGDEEHVVDLRVQVDAAVARVQPAGEPGDPGVLQVVGGRAPVGGKANEERHLLAAVKVVDDRRSARGRGDRVGSELGDLLGVARVADRGRVVPEALGADRRARLQAGRGEVTGVGEREQLLHAGVAATAVDRTGAKLGAGVDVELHHAHAVLELVGIQLVPLVGGQGALVAGRAPVVVADLGRHDNPAVVADIAGVESREAHTRLGDQQGGVRDAVRIEPRGRRTGRRRVLGDHQDVGQDRAVADGSRRGGHRGDGARTEAERHGGGQANRGRRSSSRRRRRRNRRNESGSGGSHRGGG